MRQDCRVVEFILSPAEGLLATTKVVIARRSRSNLQFRDEIATSAVGLLAMT
jgi:hypothetical protein